MPQHIAIDLGAESGRVILGTSVDGVVVAERMEVLHRFPTPSRMHDGHLRWDIAQIQAGIVHGLTLAAARGPVDSIGVDTWGVDYGLYDHAGRLIADPICYRDPRTDGVAAQVMAKLGGDAFIARSGVAPLSFNTVFQLVAQVRDDRGLLERARWCLPISDVFHHWLSGVPAWERTQVGTWGLATPGARAFDRATMRELNIPDHLFGEITPSGTPLGHLRPELIQQTGLTGALRVICPAGHDTASAVAAMPGDPRTTAYLSSGTWSLLGAIADEPVLTPAFRADGLSNEIAHDGRVRLNKNIMGLWIIQECRRDFVANGRHASYGELAEAAGALPPSPVPLDVDDQRFLAPSAVAGPMPERIRTWCRERGVAAPTTDAALIRLATDGLAAAYARGLAALERHAGRRFETIAIIGGGSQNTLLNLLTAEATGRRVTAGPVEATALGNLTVQMNEAAQSDNPNT